VKQKGFKNRVAEQFVWYSFKGVEQNMTDIELLAEWQARATYIYDALYAGKSICDLSPEQKACVGMLADMIATQLRGREQK